MNQYQSESIDLLMTALAKAQGEMSAASKDCKGYNYKYADLASVWEACRGPISHNGLAVTQIETQNDQGEILVTILGHSSGQWIRSVMAIRVKPSGKTNELQERGSVLTYLRRYALSAIVGVAPDDDDDGNAATSYKGVEVAAVPKTITAQQAAELREIISKCSPGFKQYVSDFLKKGQLRDLNALPEALCEKITRGAIDDLKAQQAALETAGVMTA